MEHGFYGVGLEAAGPGEDTGWTDDVILQERAIFPLDSKGSKRFNSRGTRGGHPGWGEGSTLGKRPASLRCSYQTFLCQREESRPRHQEAGSWAALPWGVP